MKAEGCRMKDEAGARWAKDERVVPLHSSDWRYAAIAAPCFGVRLARRVKYSQRRILTQRRKGAKTRRNRGNVRACAAVHHTHAVLSGLASLRLCV